MQDNLYVHGDRLVNSGFLETDGPIDTGGPEIVHRVGLIGGLVVSAIKTQPQLFPYPILGAAAELHTDIQVIDLTGRRTDDVDI